MVLEENSPQRYSTISTSEVQGTVYPQLPGAANYIIQVRFHYSDTIYESVDLIAFLFNIEANKKIYHRHIIDIPRINFLV